MYMIRRFLAVLFSMIFFVYFIFFVFVFSINQTIFNREVYLDETFIDNTYSVISDYSFSLFLDQYGQNFIQKDDFLYLFKKSFTKENLKTEVNFYLDQIATSNKDFESNIISINLIFDFIGKYKESFLANFSPFVFANLQSCEESLDNQNCLPPGVDFSMFNKEFEKELDRFFVNQFTQDFSIEWFVSDKFEGNASQVYSHIYFVFLSLSFFVLVFILILIGLFVYNGLFSLFSKLLLLIFVSSVLSYLFFYFSLNSNFVSYLLKNSVSEDSFLSFFPEFIKYNFFYSFNFVLVPIILSTTLLFIILKFKESKYV